MTDQPLPDKIDKYKYSSAPQPQSTGRLSIYLLRDVVGIAGVLIALLGGVGCAGGWIGGENENGGTIMPTAEVAVLSPSDTPTPTVMATNTPRPTQTPTPTEPPTPSPTPLPEAVDVREVTLPDGEMEVRMRYVPGGPFEMGSESNEASDREAPQHEVNVDPFWMDETEVTNVQYAAFVAATGHDNAGSTDNNDEYSPANHPVVRVSWYDAQVFCAWRGARLPTEAEWEKGARGTDGRVYPWGNNYDAGLANDLNESGRDEYGLTAPVGMFSPQGNSPYGLRDMAGNVLEWTGTIYAQDEFPYPYEADDGRNPDVNEISNETRMVMRGGSWLGNAQYLRAAFRDAVNADARGNGVGFRCASPSP